MGNKHVKKKKGLAPTQDPYLEPVDEDREFEVEYDEETNEVVFVMHYRRHWGDDMDADVEHGLTMEDNNSLICSLMDILEVQKSRILQQQGTVLEAKSTPELVEGNPVREFKHPKDIVDGVVEEIISEPKKGENDV